MRGLSDPLWRVFEQFSAELRELRTDMSTLRSQYGDLQEDCRRMRLYRCGRARARHTAVFSGQQQVTYERRKDCSRCCEPHHEIGTRSCRSEAVLGREALLPNSLEENEEEEAKEPQWVERVGRRPVFL